MLPQGSWRLAGRAGAGVRTLGWPGVTGAVVSSVVTSSVVSSSSGLTSLRFLVRAFSGLNLPLSTGLGGNCSTGSSLRIGAMYSDQATTARELVLLVSLLLS